MKFLRHILGLGLLLAVMVKCGSSPDSPALTGTPSHGCTAALEALEEIDSLMWKQPDSALTVMLKFAASPEADSLDEFEGHYCQMLISELLYKNDYGQSNREDLLKAVDYFDSIVAADGYKTDGRKANTRGVSLQKRNAFLDARAHYIDGVGYYEKGDVIDACAEYLKTLEIIDTHFPHVETQNFASLQPKHLPRFLFYTYNRLLELFSAQYMMASAIKCGEEALVYCQKDPSLSKEIPNTYFHIGKQYDMMREKDLAREYYSRAIEGLSDINSLVYRDAVSAKALCDYQVWHEADSSLFLIRQMLAHANSEKEKLTRFLAIGGIFTIEQSFDSALYYFKTVFENTDNILFQITAAEYLLINYNHLGNKEKADEFVRFLGEHKKSEGKDKALVSQLEDMFKNYQNQKQEKEAEAEREESIKKTIKIIVPIAVVVVLAIIILAKLKSKKLLKEQQEEAERRFGVTEQEHENELRRLQAEAEQRLTDAERKHQQKVKEMAKRHEEELKLQKDQTEQEIARTKKRHEEELEAERSAYQKEREDLERSLQQSKENVSALQEELGRKRTGAAEHYAAFLEEPVCIKINGLVRDLHITTRKPYSHYHISLDNETIAQLSEAVTAHYGELQQALLCHCPGISHEDLLLCYLYLLGLSNKQIAVLRQRDYSTVRKQAKELMGKLRIDETVREYVLRLGGIEGVAEE